MYFVPQYENFKESDQELKAEEHPDTTVNPCNEWQNQNGAKSRECDVEAAEPDLLFEAPDCTAVHA